MLLSTRISLRASCALIAIVFFQTKFLLLSTCPPILLLISSKPNLNRENYICCKSNFVWFTCIKIPLCRGRARASHPARQFVPAIAPLASHPVTISDRYCALLFQCIALQCNKEQLLVVVEMPHLHNIKGCSTDHKGEEKKLKNWTVYDRIVGERMLSEVE